MSVSSKASSNEILLELWGDTPGALGGYSWSFFQKNSKIKAFSKKKTNGNGNGSERYKTFLFLATHSPFTYVSGEARQIRKTRT